MASATTLGLALAASLIASAAQPIPVADKALDCAVRGAA
jgi:hypothetical protein